MTDNQVTTIQEELSLEDIFQSDEDIAEEAPIEEPIEEEDSETPTEEETESEGEDSTEEPKEDAIASLEKRLKDTQRFGHRQKNKADKVLAKMLEEGKISEEEYTQYNSDEEPLVDDLAGELTKIEADTRKDLEVIAEALPDRDVKAEYENYVKLTQAYPKLAMDLLEIPANKRLSHMIGIGSKSSDVLDLLEKHDGNVIEALRSSVGDDKVAAAETAGYERAKAEFKEQMKELSSDKRPSLRSTAKQTIKEDDDGEVNLDFL